MMKNKENPSDLMMSDALLTQDELSLRESLKKFVAKKITPLLQEAHRKEEFPKHLVKELGEMGLFGITLKDYGNMNSLSYGLAMQELEKADSAIRSFCSVQNSLVMWPIEEFGSEEQKSRFLPKLATGEFIGCFGLTESDAGSDPVNMKTRVKKVAGGGYELSGSKMWITNGHDAQVGIIWAKNEEQEIVGVLIEKGMKGFTSSKIQGKFSLRISSTAELSFDKVLIPEENILPKAKGIKSPLRCLNEARFGIACGVIGAAETVFHCALDYAKEREIFGKKLASFQLAQAKLVEMSQEISKAKLLAIQLGRLKEQKKLSPIQVSLGKMNNCKMALEAARKARDLLGAYGIVDDFPVMRHLMNLETVNTYEGTEDIHRLIIGREITGHSAFY